MPPRSPVITPVTPPLHTHINTGPSAETWAAAAAPPRWAWGTAAAPLPAAALVPPLAPPPTAPPLAAVAATAGAGAAMGRAMPFSALGPPPHALSVAGPARSARSHGDGDRAPALAACYAVGDRVLCRRPTGAWVEGSVTHAGDGGWRVGFGGLDYPLDYQVVFRHDAD
eukprot:gene5590-49795_t